jgi:hypothetical protein
MREQRRIQKCRRPMVEEEYGNASNGGCGSPPASSRQSPRSQPAPSAPALASRPTTTPFIQALASGADGARAELMRQEAGMVADRMDWVFKFLTGRRMSHG